MSDSFNWGRNMDGSIKYIPNHIKPKAIRLTPRNM